MEKRRLGKTDLSVSVLGFGGAPFGYLDTERVVVSQILNRLLDKGINVIDTAAVYDGSEEAIGDLIGHRRSDYTLISKCGAPQDGCPAEAWSTEVVEFTVDQALRRLKTDHLDVMLIHSCGLEYLKQGDAWIGLERARDAGKVRFIGYSGDDEAIAYAACLPGISVVETSVNIVDQRNIDVALPSAREKDLGVIAKRPIGNAAWKEIDQQAGFYRSYTAEYADRFRAMGLTPESLGFEGDPAAVWPEIALRFTLSQPDINVAIIGTTDPRHAESNIEAASKGPLAPDTVEAIRSAFYAADPSRQWLGLT